jgi:hypothetical protein
MSTVIANLAEWGTFYIIVGSAAGALIGLQFVVMTLMAQRPITKDEVKIGSVFATPTIFHFGAALFLSALLRALWQTFSIPAAILTIIGLCGLVYVLTVALRIRKEKQYLPVLEDWLFHVALPLVAYILLAWSIFIDPSFLYEVLFGVGAAALLLLFVGIHNAWDSVTYMVFIRGAEG